MSKRPLSPHARALARRAVTQAQRLTSSGQSRRPISGQRVAPVSLPKLVFMKEKKDV